MPRSAAPRSAAILPALAVAALLLLPGHTVRAADRTVGQFLSACRTDPITCVLDAQDAIIDAEVDKGVSCPADGVTDREAQALIKWLDAQVAANPSAANRALSEMQLEGAKTLWPCV